MSNANFVQGALSVPVAIDGLIMTLGEAVAPYSLPPTDGGILVLADSVSRPSFVEIISYTSRSGQNLTGVLRAQEGTTARAWGVGTYVYQSLTAAQFNSVTAALTGINTALAAINGVAP